MSKWALCCAEKDQDLTRRALDSIDAAARVTIARSQDELRALVSGARPGELGVVIGNVEKGVSDVNLAAAVAKDGNARFVVLARADVTGSLRSRAARAGVDLVIDLSEPRGGGPFLVTEDGGRSLPEGPLPAQSEAGSAPFSPEDAPAAPNAPAAPDVPAVPGRAPDPAPAAPDRAPDPAPAAPDRAPVLVVCSGRGGVGKTTVAAAASAVAARWGLRVCLLDLDLSCGNAYVAFGLSGGSDLAELAGSAAVTRDLLARLIVSAGPGVSLAGPCARPETSELALPLVGSLIGAAAHASDLVVVDTSTTFTDAVAQAAQAADRLLILSDARSGSVAPAARMSGLAVRLGIARTRIARLENRLDPRARVAPPPGGAEVGLEAARVYRVRDGGREVADLLAAGRVHDLVEPGTPFSDSIAATVAQLLSELGRLPDCEEARRAARGERPAGWRALLGMRREAR